MGTSRQYIIYDYKSLRFGHHERLIQFIQIYEVIRRGPVVALVGCLCANSLYDDFPHIYRRITANASQHLSEAVVVLRIAPGFLTEAQERMSRNLQRLDSVPC